jgi:hypothetical protein
MKLTDYSRHKLLHTFAHWKVDKDYSDPMFNYLVYGYSPGSFFTAVLANDFLSAVACSHSANTIPALKNLSGWIRDNMPSLAYGSYEAVHKWCKLSEDQRRLVLEECRLIYTSKEETWKILKGEATQEPVIW